MEHQPPKRHPLFAILAGIVALVAVLWLGTADHSRPRETAPPREAAYFHTVGGNAVVDPADVSFQAKRVAAARHVPVGDVRLLIQAHTTGKEGQRVEVTELNRALDELWPMR